jgi:hypothetical protein
VRLKLSTYENRASATNEKYIWLATNEYFACAATNGNKASSFQALAINEENFSTGYLRIKLTVEAATTRPLFHVRIKVRQFLFKNTQTDYRNCTRGVSGPSKLRLFWAMQWQRAKRLPFGP